MELDVTHMVDDSDDMPTLSGSMAELGQDAGKITWNNSLAYAAGRPLLSSDDEREQAREYFKGFGAWSESEIAAWSENELQAMVVQYIAGDIREMERFDNDADYQKAAEAGTVSGRLYKDSAGRWWFSMSD